MRTRLWGAFGCIAALTIAATLLAHFSYADVERLATRVVSESLPNATLTSRLARASGELVAAAPTLSATDNHAELNERAGVLRRKATQVIALSQSLADRAAPTADPNDIVATARRIGANLDDLVAAHRRRLDLHVAQQADLAAFVEQHEATLAQLRPKLQNARQRLVLDAQRILNRGDAVLREALREALAKNSDAAVPNSEAPNSEVGNSEVGNNEAAVRRGAARLSRLDARLSSLVNDRMGNLLGLHNSIAQLNRALGLVHQIARVESQETLEALRADVDALLDRLATGLSDISNVEDRNRPLRAAFSGILLSVS